MKVLLIDDDSIFHLIHRKLLGFHADVETVIEASSGPAALQMLQDSVTTDSIPDVILVDLDMPGMDGFAFVERYNASGIGARKKIFVSVLSSSSSYDDTERAKKLGVAFLNKPLDVAAMRAAMASTT